MVRQPYKSRKPGRPYLDGIEYTIIPNRSTAILAFITGMFDLTFPYEVTVPLLKGVKQQSPQAVCDLVSTNASTNLLVNREAPPFDNPDLRRALALALDRKSFIDILAEGQGDIGGAMLPPPAGVWGMPADLLATIPGYGPDVAKNRAKSVSGTCFPLGARTLVFVGIETPDEAALVLTQKKQNTRRSIPESVRRIYDAGMFVVGGFIVGFDTETDNERDRRARPGNFRRRWSARMVFPYPRRRNL